MTRKTSRAKAHIPKVRRVVEKGRRLVKAFAADLRESVTNSKPARKRRDSPGAATRPNPWPKCPTCFHRVPQLCEFCRRGRAGVADNHTDACCPGDCPSCRRCLMECPGQCDRCGQCRDRCRGHDETTRDDRDNHSTH